MTDTHEDLQRKIAVLECMVEDAGVYMMMTNGWPLCWLEDPQYREILFDLNVGPYPYVALHPDAIRESRKCKCE